MTKKPEKLLNRTVNQLVPGSSPGRGATSFSEFPVNRVLAFFMRLDPDTPDVALMFAHKKGLALSEARGRHDQLLGGE